MFLWLLFLLSCVPIVTHFRLFHHTMDVMWKTRSWFLISQIFFTFILIIVYLQKHTHTHNEHLWRQHGGFYICCCCCFIFLLSDNFDLVNCNFSVLHQPLNICCCYCCCWYKHIQIYKVMNDDRRQTVC